MPSVPWGLSRLLMDPGQAPQDAEVNQDPWTMLDRYAQGMTAERPQAGAQDWLSGLASLVGLAAPMRLSASQAAPPIDPNVPVRGSPVMSRGQRVLADQELVRREAEARDAILSHFAKRGLKATPEEMEALSTRFSGPPFHGNFNMADAERALMSLQSNPMLPGAVPGPPIPTGGHIPPGASLGPPPSARIPPTPSRRDFGRVQGERWRGR
jgi:hypothetical protein